MTKRRRREERDGDREWTIEHVVNVCPTGDGCIRVSRKRSATTGRTFIDVRRWIASGDGRLWPLQRGVSVEVESADALVAAIREAVEAPAAPLAAPPAPDPDAGGDVDPAADDAPRVSGGLPF